MSPAALLRNLALAHEDAFIGDKFRRVAAVSRARVSNGGALARHSAGTAAAGLLARLMQRFGGAAVVGDPMRRLIWVSKSMEKLAAALTEMGHPISADTVRKELVKLGFSRQSNRKADEGAKHPDRNAQFEYINAKVVAAQAQQQPVISVDTKKKELIGNFKNGGTDYRPKGKPRRVNVHDFGAENAVVDVMVVDREGTRTIDPASCLRPVSALTLSLAFMSPALAEAAMEGRLPRGFSIKRLTDLPMLWSEQWGAIGLQAPAQVRAELR